MPFPTTLTSRLSSVCALIAAAIFSDAAEPFDPERGILLKGTVVTMDANGTIIPDGRVLVRGNSIIAVWSGEDVPQGVTIGDAELVSAPDALIFPGMIDLHQHPTYNFLPLWLPPRTHAQPQFGRDSGAEPYTHRDEWGRNENSPTEYRRVVSNPQRVVTSGGNAGYLGLRTEVVKWSEAKALLGGVTSIQGATTSPQWDTMLARNVDNSNFGRDRVEFSVFPLTLTPTDVANMRAALTTTMFDAVIVHLGEGTSAAARDELRLLRNMRTAAGAPGDNPDGTVDLLADQAVIIHGTGLEYDDFVQMRNAPLRRTPQPGDGLGAKLVWSPFSNLLLYGKTTKIYDAVRAGLTISLGTDWGPSGSHSLLDELKIADIALRHPALLGPARESVPQFAIAGKSPEEIAAAERVLDELLVRMVTANPAATLHWSEVGQVVAGKRADLILISKPPVTGGMPDSPYRNLIDAAGEDIRLVLVDGEPLAGDVPIMNALKGERVVNGTTIPADYEIVRSSNLRYEKAFDATKEGVTKGTQTLAQLENILRGALRMLGGDNLASPGGVGNNSYSQLKAAVPRFAAMTQSQFIATLINELGETSPGSGIPNIEAIELNPLLTEDDDFFFHVANALGLGAPTDPTPPYAPYTANHNHVQANATNPFARDDFRVRWYRRAPVPPLSITLDAEGRLEIRWPARSIFHDLVWANDIESHLWFPPFGAPQTSGEHRLIRDADTTPTRFYKLREQF